jgi:hypothetical protein
MLKELNGDGKEKRFRKLLGREYMETEGLAVTLRKGLNNLSPTSPIVVMNLD